MGDVVSFAPSPSGPHLAIIPNSQDERRGADLIERWYSLQLSDAMASLAIAGADIAEAQKLFHQQGTDPQTMINADTIESIVLALIPAIHLTGSPAASRALYDAAIRWLKAHQGGDDVR
ncbi:hypothetical protein [Rhizobium rhizogenes]|uniref:hypothetical protein n=1 Tax=Rhizobium rhizogenes TaxID=359 RepID=UPI001574355F|nr:hypothetical protein [Rhizobium rhizogenes]NTI27635.1 hypothetical protein [Rhizobium rhizogenes]